MLPVRVFIACSQPGEAPAPLRIAEVLGETGQEGFARSREIIPLTTALTEGV
jgi:hypothetical protein